MSSHHIIREGQEPPLFIMDSESVANPILAGLLEWSPVVVTLPDAIPALIHKGVKVDYLITPENEISRWHKVFDNRYPVGLKRASNSEEMVKILMELMSSLRSDVLHVLCNNIGLRGQFEPIPRVVIFAGQGKWTWHPDGYFRKWMKNGQWMEIIGSVERITGDVSVNGSKILIEKEGIVQMSGLNRVWLGEFY